jgi:hypothetical protein
VSGSDESDMMEEGDRCAAAGPPPGPLDQVAGGYEGLGSSRAIFRIWVLIYGLVGAQMGWLLRPFIGRPDMEFTWFRNREGNFFLGVLQHIKTLLDIQG